MILHKKKGQNFSDALLLGVIPPPKKHDPGKIPGTWTMCSPNFGKKWEIPPPHPADGPVGGCPLFFFRFRRQGGVGARDLPEKLVKTGGTPFLSTFWPFWAKVAQTGEFLEPPWSARYSGVTIVGRIGGAEPGGGGVKNQNAPKLDTSHPHLLTAQKGSILYVLCLQCPNTPSRCPLSSPPELVLQYVALQDGTGNSPA